MKCFLRRAELGISVPLGTAVMHGLATTTSTFLMVPPCVTAEISLTGKMWDLMSGAKLIFGITNGIKLRLFII